MLYKMATSQKITTSFIFFQIFQKIPYAIKPIPNRFLLPQDSSGKGITTIPEKIDTAAIFCFIHLLYFYCSLIDRQCHSQYLLSILYNVYAIVVE